MNRSRAARRLAAVAVALPLAVAGCRQGMFDDARIEPYEASPVFADGSSARPLPAGTVARGRLAADPVLATGAVPGGGFAPNPLPITRELLTRGRERYDVFCSPCHDRVGTGRGMIVRRGYQRPPSFHEPRLKEIADGHIFDVATRGFGQMPSYASQVAVEDRWAIVAYVRALQLSQDAELAALPAATRRVAERALAGQPSPVPAAARPAEPVPDTVGDRPPAPVGEDFAAPVEGALDVDLGDEGPDRPRPEEPRR
ncbi:MAG TPA: cytochrome c [Thermoanaerobaculia bacterium]